MAADPSDRLEFQRVDAGGHHIHCYLDRYYVARITLFRDHCAIDGRDLVPCQVPNEEEAREVVRMWVRRIERPVRTLQDNAARS
jgi:hypothetical protein